MSAARNCYLRARELVGTRWKHKGRNPAFGIDCIGLVILAVSAGGVAMRDRKNYGRDPWKDGLRGDIEAHFGAPVARDGWRAGSVVLLRWADHEEPAHVGILGEGVNGLTLIHCFNADSVMSTVEHDIDDRWRALIVDVYWPWGEV